MLSESNSNRSKSLYVDDVVAKVAPVKLGRERENEYLQTFFARKKSGKIKTNDYRELGTYLLTIATGINRCFHLAQTLLERADYLDDAEPQEVIDYIKRAASELNRLTEVSGNTREKRKAIQEFNIFLHDNHAYTIEKSARYNGGYDIILGGSGGSDDHSSVPTWNVVYPATKFGNSIGEDNSAVSSSEYERLKLEKYSTDLSLKVLRAVKEIQEFLIGAVGDAGSLAQPVSTRTEFDKDFNEVEKIFLRNLNLTDSFGFFREYNATLKNRASFSQNFQVLIQRQPEQDLTNRLKRVRQLEDRARMHGSESLTPEQRELLEREDHFKNIPEERILAAVKFSASIVINLQEDFCRYISQTAKGPVPLYSIISWFNPWSRYYLKAANQTPSGGEQVGFQALPRYIVSARNSKDLVNYRKELGYHVDEGRSDEVGITVGPRGNLMYVPNAEKTDLSTAVEFEDAMSAYLEENFKHGLGQGITLSKDNEYRFDAKDVEDVRNSLKDRITKISQYQGALLVCNWDYSTVQYVAKNSTRITSLDLTGATKPTNLAIAEVLGMDMSQEGERPIVTDFAKAMANVLDGLGRKHLLYIDHNSYRYSHDVKSNLPAKYGMLTFRTFRALFQTIVYGITRGHLPGLSEVINKAKDELDLISTNSNPYEKRIYEEVMDENFNIKVPTSTPDQIVYFLMEIVSAAIRDAAGTTGTNLYAEAVLEHSHNADVEVKNHPRFFRREESTLQEFGNVYNYFGGLIFKMYCSELLKLDAKALSASLDVDAKGKPVPDAVLGYQLPGFNTLSTEVMPFAAMFAKYVPEALDYIERAEAEMDNLLPDDSIDASDIKMAGMAEGLMVFPHQLDSHRTLRRRPQFAILDVSPGGGKTILLLLDIGCTIAEDPEPVRALVACPSKLVPNWCEDMTKVSNGNWNVIPLDTAVINRWTSSDEGINGLVDLMKNAPPNTVFVAGIDFIKSKPFPVSFGSRAVTAYGGVEILKRAGFNYIALDESHKAKRLTSGIHKSLKTLTTMSNVKYIRLATGTFVPKEVHDVVGQTALLSSNIFKNLPYFTEEFGKDPDDKETRGSFAPDAPFRVRSKLKRSVAVVAKKRKEWAFMLPSPQDFLIEVDMENPKNPGSIIHRQVYIALLEVLDKEVQKASKAKREDGDEAEDADNEEGEALDDDEEFGIKGVDEEKLQYYLQRLEQLVTDPWGDEAGQSALEAAGYTPSNFVPEKIKAVIERVKGHFGAHDNGESEANGSIRKWIPGIICRELDLVEYDNELWLARKKSDGPKRQMLSPSTKPPTSDPENWKSEARGKLIIFTRYKRSCKAVFDNLPPEYKSMAVAYHGDEPKREENLDKFKNDPNVKIIVANEQSITEGHNLQMASRIIRVDTPWTPGDYEQSTARIFRPDPSAAKLDANGNPGEMKREVIFIDWVMTSNSSEVVKVARLMARSVEVVKYEEAENDHYDELHEISLPLVSMGWSELVQGGTVQMYAEHFYAKRILGDLQKAEFHEMRKKTVAAMIPLEATPPAPDFKIMTKVPIAANQKIADREGHGFERFMDYLGHDRFEIPLTRKDLLNMLVGLPVRTELGYGIVKGVTSVNYQSPAAYSSGGERLLEQGNPINGTTSLKIVYPGDTEEYLSPANTCHVATTIDENTFNTVYRGQSQKRKSKKSDKSRSSDRVTARKDQDKAEKRERVSSKERAEVKTSLGRAKRTGEKRNKRKDNIRSGRKVNAGIEIVKSEQAKRVRSGVTVEPTTAGTDGGKDMRLRIIPSLYDGYIAIHANLRDPDSQSLSKLGFVEFGSYIYIETKRYDPYWTVIEWLESQLKRQRLSLDRNTEKRLESIQDAFEDVDKFNYNVVLAAKTASTLPTFFRTRHRDLKDKTKVKGYPMVLPDRLRICFDLRTNPKLEKWAGRKVPGVPGKGWVHHEGMSIFLATTVSEARRKIKELESNGYTITNKDKALGAIGDMKLTRAITKARGE